MTEDAVLVTGAAGFLGRALCEAIHDEGGVVHAVVRPGETPPACRHAIVADVRAASDMEKLRDPAVRSIYHLAGTASVPQSVTDPRTDFETNVGGTLNMLELARTLDLDSFLFTSSVSVLDDGNPMPFAEEARYGPNAPYGAGKMAAEAYCLAYHRTYGTPTKVTRLFNVYGPGRQGLVVYDLISKVLADPGQLPILGDGGQTRDFLYVDDAVAGIRRVACAGPPGESYHLGSGLPTTVLQLAREIVRQAGSPGAVVVPTGDTWKGDKRAWYADTGKARALGFSPTTDLPTGIASTIAWVRTQRTA